MAEDTSGFGKGVGASIVSGVMDFMNSAINNLWADNRSRKDRARDWYYYQLQSNLDYKYNQMAMEKSAQLNKQQYDYEYAKESPAARKAQYLAAGLNPGLMYSNGLAGMQGSVGSVQPATSHGNMPNKSMPFNPIGVVDLMDNILKASQSNKESADAGLKEEQTQTEDLKQITEQLEQEIAKKESLLMDKKTTALDLENAKTKEEYDRLVRLRDRIDEELEASIENIRALTNERDALARKHEQEAQTEEFKRQNLASDTALKEEQAKTEGVKRENIKEDTALKGEFSKTEQEKRKEIVSRVNLNKAEVDQLDAVARKYNADAEYREHVNEMLKRYGLDVSGSGLYSSIERGFAHLGHNLNMLLRDLFGSL